MWAMEVVA